MTGSVLIKYFGLTFAISWSLWLAAPALGEFDPTLAGVADRLATFGPALAALVLVVHHSAGRSS